MQEMSKEGIIKRIENSKYIICSKWAKETYITVERIKIRQEIGPIAEGNHEIRTLTFNSYKDYVDFIRSYERYFLEHINKGEKNTICWLVDHATRGIYNTGSNTERIKKLKEKNVELYVAVSGNTLLDKFAKNIFETLGFKNMELNVPYKFGMHIAIYNNIAVCAILPQEIETCMNDLYKKTNKLNNINLISTYIAKVASLLGSVKGEIIILIVKNKNLVRIYKNYILSAFNKTSNE